MTPSEIEILIHCHVCVLPHPRRDAPAVKDALRCFEDNGVIVRSGDTYTTTLLGAAWMRALTRVPCPRQVFLDERGEVV